MDYPNDKEVLETFDCDTTASFRYCSLFYSGDVTLIAHQFLSYRFSHINRTIKALQSSLKTSLRIDAEGVLSLQFLSYSTSPRGGTAVSSIIDFKVMLPFEQVWSWLMENVGCSVFLLMRTDQVEGEPLHHML